MYNRGDSVGYVDIVAVVIFACLITFSPWQYNRCAREQSREILMIPRITSDYFDMTWGRNSYTVEPKSRDTTVWDLPFNCALRFI